MATPTHLLTMTAASLDYAGVHEVWVMDRRTEETWGEFHTDILRPISMPPVLDSAPLRVRSGNLAIAIDPMPEGTRLRAKIPGARFDIMAELPADHERLGVVIPWSPKRFQYTVKDIARSASGWIETDGIRNEVPAGKSWATLDHGRGRWPYSIEWTWGAASGKLPDGRTVGIQSGNKWTDGTGMTENSLFVDGRITKLGRLTWDYDIKDWRSPWRIHGPGADLEFTPFYNKQSRANLGIVSSRTDQCFGIYSGTIHPQGAEPITFGDVVGWAEDVTNRW